MATVESAQAITTVSNLSETSSTSDYPIINTNVTNASSFTVNGDDYILNSITARLGEITEGNIFINLHSDNGGIPGTILGQLSTTADIASGNFGNILNDYLFTPQTSINLNSNTTYWLSASATTGNYGWQGTNSFNQTGNWTIGDRRAFSLNGGSSWSTTSYIIPQFNIDADVASAAVPFEFSPAMGLLLVGGLFGGKAAYGKYRANKVKLKN